MNLVSWVTDKQENVTVDFTTLKGNAFSSWEINPYAEEDEAWLGRVKSNVIPQIASMCNIVVNITPEEDVPCLELAAVVVEKGTGKITIPTPKDTTELAGKKGGSSSKRNVELSFTLSLGPKGIMDGPKDSTHRSVAGSLRRLESTLDTTFNEKGYTAMCVYNGTRRLAVPMLSECARELLRSQALNQPDSRRLAILRRYDPNPTTRFEKYNEVFIYLNVMNVVGNGLYLCDLASCRKMGKMVCRSCAGSWACSEKHQMEYADDHEEWCKTHRIRI